MCKWIISSLLAGLLIGCSSDDKDEYERLSSAIAEGQNLWSGNELTNYVYTYQVSPQDCPTADELPAVEIHVENGEVTEVYLTSDGTAVSVANQPTIDGLFVIMKAAILTNPVQFSATKQDKSLPRFEADLGYPISFYIDQSSADCDAYSYSITSFN